MSDHSSSSNPSLEMDERKQPPSPATSAVKFHLSPAASSSFEQPHQDANHERVDGGAMQPTTLTPLSEEPGTFEMALKLPPKPTVIETAAPAAAAAADNTLTIHFNQHSANLSHTPPFPTNEITTSKYHWWNFLPLNLFEQFRRFANLYFLVVTIMQGIPVISPFPIYTSLIPLIFILAVSALKEALEDWSRHKADDIANGRSYLVLMEEDEMAANLHRTGSISHKPGSAASMMTPQKSSVGRTGSAIGVATPRSLSKRKSALIEPERFHKVTSKYIKVGQVLLIKKDEEFPADLLLLSSSSSDATCFVNTANLDGEAVPKIRSAPAATMTFVTPTDISNIKGTIVVEKPSSSMYRFQGRLQLDADFVKQQQSTFKDVSGIQQQLDELAATANNHEVPQTPKKLPSLVSTPGSKRLSRRGSAMKLIDGCYHYPLNDQQLLLRGSKLVNTAWVYGVVIYTGRETKLMLNRNAPKFKFSKFEQILNSFVIKLFLFNLVVCILLAAATALRDQTFVDFWKISLGNKGVGFILNFLTQYILFSFMIPMSLYVTIELVKVGQAKFMEWDTRMKYHDPDTGEWKSMIVKNSSICEELGNLEMIFSDKTGTLTMNKMELTAVSVGGKLYRDVNSSSTANDTTKPQSTTQPIAHTNGKATHPIIDKDYQAPLSLKQVNELENILCTPRDHVLLAENGQGKIYTFEPYQLTSRTVSQLNPHATNLAPTQEITILETPPEPLQRYDPNDHDLDLIRAAPRPPSTPSHGAGGTPRTPLNIIDEDGTLTRIRRPSAIAADERQQTTPTSRTRTTSIPTINEGQSGVVTNVSSHSSRKSSPNGPHPAISHTLTEVPILSHSSIGNTSIGAAPESDSTEPLSHLMHTDHVLQDLINRAFSTLKGDAIYPQDSIELDYLLDLLCCNSVNPIKKKPKKNGVEVDEDDEDDEEDEEEEVNNSPKVKFEDTFNTPIKRPLATPDGSPASTLTLNDVASSSSAMSSPVKSPINSHASHDARLATAQFTFSSSSPDEIALCESLDRCGLTFVERHGDNITIRYTPANKPPHFFRYVIKATLEFTSTRARMDVVVATPDGRIKVFVKGSDQRVLRMVAPTSLPTIHTRAGIDAASLLEVTSLQLSAFAKTGSRTLLMAGRTLSASDASRFQTAYDEAANSLNDRETLIEKAFTEVEQAGLELLGSSAVEDQLQVGVADAIDFLLKGGLKIMILTGDRLETAMTIGHQSRLLQPYMRVLQVTASESKDNIEQMLKENLEIVLETPPTDAARDGANLARQRLNKPQLPPLLPPIDGATNPNLLGYALAIDGSSLEVCLRHFGQEFIALFLHTATIITYRSTPKQKSLAVQVVKDELGKTVLAIGDGANDVSMIQEANVGVGILGKEGAHAALSSDYVIHRFIHLVPLMFLHGRFNYYRTAKIVFFSFYKNMIFPMPMIVFSFYSYNSGQVLYIPILMSCFNLFFTSLPPLITGWYERDVPEDILMQHPSLYAAFKKYTIFNTRHFYEWMIQGLVHGFILFYAMYGIMGAMNDNDIGGSIFHPNGHTTNLFLSGMQVFLTVIVLANLKMTTTLNRVTLFNIIGAILGVAALLIITAIISAYYFPDLAPDAYGLIQALFDTNITWLYLLLCLATCYLPSLAIGSYFELYHPTPIQAVCQASAAHTTNTGQTDPSAESRAFLLELLSNGGTSPSPPPTTNPKSTTDTTTPPPPPPPVPTYQPQPLITSEPIHEDITIIESTPVRIRLDPLTSGTSSPPFTSMIELPVITERGSLNRGRPSGIQTTDLTPGAPLIHARQTPIPSSARSAKFVQFHPMTPRSSRIHSKEADPPQIQL